MTDQASPYPIPRINEVAPDFEANSTHGPLKLSDYRGKWVVLFAHPADFTPVCTTEFIGFARHADAFSARNVQLIGVSEDSNSSHLAWIANIKQNFGVHIPFPVIDDRAGHVAARFGLIHPGESQTATVRAVFVIDDKGLIRAFVYYPLTTGRSIEEILRLVIALQTTDQHKVATPEGWQPGDKVIVPAPATQAAAEARSSEGYETVDWYFSKKPLPVG
ncbi:peroxiredoxin [Methylobacillus flagellatus]|uniref:peroxiredoxin n=1 Tax=Methylobacillus flagellatus TaxID=405 RepID=UPI0010F781E5|nr:peroxiredoxin [Methylobacillus flagellatus]